MPVNYPTSLDDGTSLVNNRATGNTIPASDHNDLTNAVIATETKLGSGASTPTTAGNVLTVTGAGATAYQAPSVSSVAGKTGAVTLVPADAGAAAASHSHAEADVTSLTTDLAGKQTHSTKLDNIAALADAAGVLTNNGTGTLSWGAGGGGGSSVTGQHFFSYRPSANTNANSSSGWGAVQIFDTMIEDADSVVSSSIFTCPTGSDGLYYFEFCINWATMGSSSLFFGLSKNGANTAPNFKASNSVSNTSVADSATGTMQAQAVFILVGGDTVAVFGFRDATGGTAYGGTNAYSAYFQGYRIA